MQEKNKIIIANILMSDLKNNERVRETIDKIPLLETIQIIKDSDLFIGYDSGLLNIAFTLKKKVFVCIGVRRNMFGNMTVNL